MSRNLVDMTADDVAGQLDQDNPRWVTEFVDAKTLQQLAEGSITPATMRQRVINDTIWPVLRAVYQVAEK